MLMLCQKGFACRRQYQIDQILQKTGEKSVLTQGKTLMCLENVS